MCFDIAVPCVKAISASCTCTLGASDSKNRYLTWNAVKQCCDGARKPHELVPYHKEHCTAGPCFFEYGLAPRCTASARRPHSRRHRQAVEAWYVHRARVQNVVNDGGGQQQRRELSRHYTFSQALFRGLVGNCFARQPLPALGKREEVRYTSLIYQPCTWLHCHMQLLTRQRLHTSHSLLCQGQKETQAQLLRASPPFTATKLRGRASMAAAAGLLSGVPVLNKLFGQAGIAPRTFVGKFHILVKSIQVICYLTGGEASRREGTGSHIWQLQAKRALLGRSAEHAGQKKGGAAATRRRPGSGVA